MLPKASRSWSGRRARCRGRKETSTFTVILITGWILSTARSSPHGPPTPSPGLRPQWAGEFQARRDEFFHRIDRSLEDWLSRLRPYAGRTAAAYHNSWPYFSRRFGFRIAGFIEPKPGIPPSPRDLARVIETVRNERIQVILHTVYYDDKPSRFVAGKTGARLLTLATSVGGAPGVDDYFDLFDHNVSLLVQAWSEAE